jgi:hypothetical protein
MGAVRQDLAEDQRGAERVDDGEQRREGQQEGPDHGAERELVGLHRAMIRAAGLRRKADVGAWIGGWARSRPRLAVRVSHPAPRRLPQAPRRGTTPRTAGLESRSFSNPIRASQLTTPICANEAA